MTTVGMSTPRPPSRAATVPAIAATQTTTRKSFASTAAESAARVSHVLTPPRSTMAGWTASSDPGDAPGANRHGSGRGRSRRAETHVRARAATTRPAASVTTRSTRSRPSSRWVTRSTERSPAAAKTSRSSASAVSGSSCAVGSSRISTGASASSARASTIRCRCPPESSRPSSPTRVSQPAGSPDTQSQMRAWRSTASISASPAPGRARPTFSRMLAENRCDSCPATAIARRTSLLAVVAQIAAGERQPAPLGVPEAEQEAHDRRLPGAARADERDAAAGREAEVDAVQRGVLAGCVAGVDALERDRERPARSRRGVRGVDDARRRGPVSSRIRRPGAERRGQLTRRGGQRLHGLERGQREQRRAPRPTPVELPRRRCAARPPRARRPRVAPVDRQPSPSPAPPSSASRRASRTSRRSAARTRSSARPPRRRTRRSPARRRGARPAPP